jgi:hypothetical protein
MLTDAQKRLIAKAKAAGFGYALFAASVERQGWCSKKQAQTLRKMLGQNVYLGSNLKRSDFSRDRSTKENQP